VPSDSDLSVDDSYNAMVLASFFSTPMQVVIGEYLDLKPVRQNALDIAELEHPGRFQKCRPRVHEPGN